MILVRDVFRLHFGKAREATALLPEGLQFMRRSGEVREARALTDLTGPYYTLVLESTYEGLAAYEQSMGEGMSDPQWKAWYQRFTPLVESGYREMFTVVGADVPSLARTDSMPTARLR